MTDVRAVDLDLFDFDYDLSWAGLLLNAEGGVYGRYGSRGPDSAESENTLEGLRHALQVARERHAAGKRPLPAAPTKTIRTASDYPEVQRMRAGACVHCHNVHDFERARLQAANEWTVAAEWRYPPAENLGLTLDRKRGDRIRDVASGSAAARAGLQPGDVLHAVNGQPVASIADVRFALQHAPARGEIVFRYQRRSDLREDKLTLESGWRKSDISWRWSLRSLDPPPPWRGGDLEPAEKRKLGLEPDQLAFLQGSFPTIPARQAGLLAGDVIVGLDGKDLHMNARQFDTHLRLYYRVGQEVVVNVLRDGKRVEVRIKLVTRRQLY